MSEPSDALKPLIGMMYWKLSILGTLAFGAMVGFAPRSASAPATIAGLQSGEKLTVDYRMSGCFASEHLSLTFWRANGLQVEVHKWVLGADGKEKRIRLGQSTLNKSDERGLDNQLRHYRSKPAGGCTTIENVQLSHLKGGRELAKEALLDASCSLKQDALGFGQLGRRFTQPKR